MSIKSSSSDDPLTPVLGIHLDETNSHLLDAALNAIPGFELAGSLHQYFGEKDAALVRAVREIHPEICIIDLDRDRGMALETVEYLRRSATSPLSIFALSSRMDSDSIIAAMRSGCTEYLAKPIQTERLQDALIQLARKKRDAITPVTHGRIITVMGVKGGVGTTTLAVHLAYAMASAGKRTLLIDHHPELGEATLHLGLEHHNYGFYELVCNLTRLDAELLQGFVLKHKSGLELLASPEAIGGTQVISPEGIQHTLRSLIRMYDYIVIDTNGEFSDRNLSIVELSDELCLITEAHLPAVRNTSRFLDYLSRLSFPASKVQVVVNRWMKNNTISIDHIEKILRRKVSLSIPNAEPEIEEAIGTGVPVSVRSRSDFMQGIGAWMRQMSGEADLDGDSRSNAKAREARSRFSVLGISM